RAPVAAGWMSSGRSCATRDHHGHSPGRTARTLTFALAVDAISLIPIFAAFETSVEEGELAVVPVRSKVLAGDGIYVKDGVSTSIPAVLGWRRTTLAENFGAMWTGWIGVLPEAP
ncbi:MAG TPA: hypothetical protein DEO85_16260, partial [Maritimibacter sp.]|nr:hypothetical protein [Maritimibacter sp.]